MPAITGIVAEDHLSQAVADGVCHWPERTGVDRTQVRLFLKRIRRFDRISIEAQHVEQPRVIGAAPSYAPARWVAAGLTMAVYGLLHG